MRVVLRACIILSALDSLAKPAGSREGDIDDDVNSAGINVKFWVIKDPPVSHFHLKNNSTVLSPSAVDGDYYRCLLIEGSRM
jgi:hypothetical protein